MSSPYEEIYEFCRTRNISKIIERILLHKYYENYNQTVENYRKKESQEPSDEIKKGFDTTLLSEATLTTNVQLAEAELKDALEKEIKSSKRKITLKDFSISVGAGVVASFLFTLLLITFLTLGQSQVKSWINDLYLNNEKMEQTVSSNQEI